MQQTLTQLQTFLNENDIPKIKGKPKTFLGIAKQPHYENVLSNIYAFYFDVNEVHHLNDLFISSLLDLININTKGLDSFLDFEVFTEYPTNDGGRIDILLTNGEQAIIIENKVYHHLNNNLQDYWESTGIQNNLDENKVGIVLSLQPIINLSHPHYINITHLELLNKVMGNLGNYLLEAQDKYVVFLKDLYQNIINLSHSFMKKENIHFYYKNQTEINQLVQFRCDLQNHIKNEVVKTGERLEGLNKYEPRTNSFNDKRLVYYVSPKHKNLMITVVYELLLEPECKMHIAVELQNALTKDRARYNAINTFTEQELEIAYSEHFKNSNENWTHFAVKHYHPTEEEVTNLSDFINKKLEDDCLLSIFKKLENFLDTINN